MENIPHNDCQIISHAIQRKGLAASNNFQDSVYLPAQPLVGYPGGFMTSRDQFGNQTTQ